MKPIALALSAVLLLGSAGPAFAQQKPGDDCLLPDQKPGMVNKDGVCEPISTQKKAGAKGGDDTLTKLRKECPFIPDTLDSLLDLEGFEATTTTLVNQMKTKTDCAGVGSKIGDLLALLQNSNGTTEAGSGGGAASGNGSGMGKPGGDQGGENPPPDKTRGGSTTTNQCVTNPAQCVATLQSVLGAVDQIKTCASDPKGALSAVASLVMKVGSKISPTGSLIGLGLGVVSSIVNLLTKTAEERWSAAEKAQKMDSLNGLYTCGSTRAFTTIQCSNYYAESLYKTGDQAWENIGTRGGGGPSLDCDKEENELEIETLQKFYACNNRWLEANYKKENGVKPADISTRLGKARKDCISSMDLKDKGGKPVTAGHILCVKQKAVKEFSTYQSGKDYLAAMADGATRFHVKETIELTKKIKSTMASKSSDATSNVSNYASLAHHCLEGYMHGLIDLKNVDTFKGDRKGLFGFLKKKRDVGVQCDQFNSCVDKLNTKHGFNHPNQSIFAGKSGTPTLESVCNGLGVINNDADFFEMTVALQGAGFDNAGSCNVDKAKEDYSDKAKTGNEANAY